MIKMQNDIPSIDSHFLMFGILTALIKKTIVSCVVLPVSTGLLSDARTQ